MPAAALVAKISAAIAAMPDTGCLMLDKLIQNRESRIENLVSLGRDSRSGQCNLCFRLRFAHRLVAHRHDPAANSARGVVRSDNKHRRHSLRNESLVSRKNREPKTHPFR